MAFIKVTISWTPCEPTPLNGYDIQLRVVGSGDPFSDFGNFATSPVSLVLEVEDPDSQFEGVIKSDCGTLFGGEIAWTTSPLT